MIRGLTSVHHIGIVVKDITKKSQYYFNLGYEKYSDVIFEQNQKVNVQFLKLDETVIELIEPVGEKSPVNGFLKKGGGLHHLCYCTTNINETMKDFKKHGAVIVCKPYISPSINDKKVAFVVTKEGEIIELVEKKDK